MKMTLLAGLAPRCPQPGCATKLGAEGAAADLGEEEATVQPGCKVPWHEPLSCPEYRRRYPHGGPNGNIREEEKGWGASDITAADLEEEATARRSGRKRRRCDARGGDESGDGATALRTRTSQESVS
jgi:hypothetical protein